MFKFSLELVFLAVFSLTSFVRPDNLTKSETTPAITTERIDYLALDSAITCKFQPNGYDCDGSRNLFPKFYYDLRLEDCKAFNMGTCPHNLNGYESLIDCHNACRDFGTHAISGNLPVRVLCRLQYDFGHCNEYYPRWYYDLTSRTCKGFSYSGCGGNLNRFMTQQLCTSSCVSLGQSGFE